MFRFRCLQWLHFIYKQDALSLEFQAQSREDFLDKFARHPAKQDITSPPWTRAWDYELWWIMYKRIVSNMSAINYSWNLCLQFKLHFQHGSEKFKGLGGIWWFVHSVQGQKPTNAMRSRDKQVRTSPNELLLTTTSTTVFLHFSIWIAGVIACLTRGPMPHWPTGLAHSMPRNATHATSTNWTWCRLVALAQASRFLCSAEVLSEIARKCLQIECDWAILEVCTPQLARLC